MQVVVWLVAALVFLGTSPSHASEEPAQPPAEPTSASARALYDQGKYSEALESLIKAGLQSPADYYNAGAALFRMGRLGQALAHFEKAHKLAPEDSDISYNLELTAKRLRDSGQLPRDSSLWLGRIVPLAQRVPAEYPELLFAAASLGFAVVAFRLKKKGQTLRQALSNSGFLGSSFLWLLAAGLVGVAASARNVELATVVADAGVVRSGPNDTFTELLKLPAGSKVEVTKEAREGWQQVRFSLGNVGWVMEKDLLKL